MINPIIKISKNELGKKIDLRKVDPLTVLKDLFDIDRGPLGKHPLHEAIDFTIMKRLNNIYHIFSHFMDKMKDRLLIYEYKKIYTEDEDLCILEKEFHCVLNESMEILTHYREKNIFTSKGIYRLFFNTEEDYKRILNDYEICIRYFHIIHDYLGFILINTKIKKYDDNPTFQCYESDLDKMRNVVHAYETCVIYLKSELIKSYKEV